MSRLKALVFERRRVEESEIRQVIRVARFFLFFSKELMGFFCRTGRVSFVCASTGLCVSSSNWQIKKRD